MVNFKRYKEEVILFILLKLNFQDNRKHQFITLFTVIGISWINALVQLLLALVITVC